MPLSTKIHLAAAPLDPRAREQKSAMLSSKAKCAVRAAIFPAGLARSEDWAWAAGIAEGATIPRKFLELILVQLRDRGLIESRRGVHGGYRLLRDPGNISVADIIRIVDGPLALTPFVSRTRFRPCTDCVDIRRCHLQPLMQQARDAVAGVLEKCPLSRTCEQESWSAASREGVQQQRCSSSNDQAWSAHVKCAACRCEGCRPARWSRQS
jgi:Rrf2 family protein